MAFLDDLKQKRLVQWALAYIAGAGLIWQALEIGRDRWGVADGAARVFDFLLILGFFLTLILVWFHGEEGRQRTRWVEIALLAALGAVGVGALFFLPSEIPDLRSGSTPIVAVLPFRGLGEEGQEIAPGLTSTVRNRLGVIDGLEVFGATSTQNDLVDGLAIPAIAERWGVDYLLLGVVERSSAGGATTVRPELYSADGTQFDFWREPLVVETEALSSLEGVIAADVAQALDVTIGAASRARLEDPATNPAAYEAYLRALRSRSGAERRSGLQDVLALDSTFAPALALLSSSAITRYEGTHDLASGVLAGELARAAVRHRPEYAQGHEAMGRYHRSLGRDHDSSLVYFTRAKELAPGDVTILHMRATALWNLDQSDAALAEARRGAALDPFNASAVSRVSRIQLSRHELDEAYERHLEARSRTRADFILTDGPLILAALGLADSARAFLSTIPDSTARTRAAAFMNHNAKQSWLIEDSLLARTCNREPRGGYPSTTEDRQVFCALEEWRRGDAASATARADSARSSLRAQVVSRSDDERLHMKLAYAHFLLGEPEAALAQADSSIALYNAYWDYYPGAVNAILYAQLTAMIGDVDRTVRQLEPMLSGHSWLTPDWLRVDPAFDAIRADPRFQALVGDSSSR